MQLKAPAKVNFHLRVARKRSDGYHEIETLFARVSLHDILTFTHLPKTPDIFLTVKGADLPMDRSNLVYLAAALLQERCGVKSGVAIILDKRIPIAAGMGGGSSDAAATLLALNDMWKLRLSTSRLLSLAAKVGSDVPFFILKARYAVGKGRGEKLSVIKSRTQVWMVLAFPDLKVLTKEMYSDLRPADYKGKVPARAADVLKAYQSKNLPGLQNSVMNSLERPILRKHSQLQELKNGFLKAGALASLISGSGPTVFGIASSRAHAASILKAMKRTSPARFCVVSTV